MLSILADGKVLTILVSHLGDVIGLLCVPIGRTNLVCCPVLGILRGALTNGHVPRGGRRRVVE